MYNISCIRNTTKKDLALNTRNFEVESCNNKAFATIPEH